jgi:hypothetical protein
MINFFELLNKHPDALVILGGDFNTCKPLHDSLNRIKTKEKSYLI